MTGCTVTNNTSSADYRVSGNYHTTGGGIYAAAGSSLTITGCSITNNYSGNHYNGLGGGVSGANATIAIRDTEFSDNVGYYGAGAIELHGGSLTIENCSIKGVGYDPSGGELYGGALLISNATAIVCQTTISGHAANYGGAVFTLTVELLYLIAQPDYPSHPSSSEPRSVPWPCLSRLTLCSASARRRADRENDSTIANNFGGYGGALYARGYGTLNIRNSTITGNHGGSPGGIELGGFDLESANCIIAGNNSSHNPDVYGAITFSDKLLAPGRRRPHGFEHEA